MFHSLRILLIACLMAVVGACTVGESTSDRGTTVSCYDTPDGVLCSEEDPGDEDTPGEDAPDGEDGDELVCEDVGCVTECTVTDYGERCVTECEGGLRCVSECEGDDCSDLICECPGDDGPGDDGPGDDGPGDDGPGDDGPGDDGPGDEEPGDEEPGDEEPGDEG